MKPTLLWETWERAFVSNARRGQKAFLDPAWHWTEGWMTHSQLAAVTLGVELHAPDDLRSGEVVAFACGNGLLWMAAFLQLQKFGAVALPLDASLPPATLAQNATRLGAHWLIGPDWLWSRLATESAPLAGDYCLIKTTSGSTGEPRPLAFTSAQMLADGRQIAATMGIGPDDVNLGAIPFGHSYGLGNLVLPLIAQGTALVCSSEILPDALAEQIERYDVTVLPSVPAVLRGLARSSVDPAKLRTLRRVISAGAPLAPEVARAFREKFGLPVQNFYGSSETGGICFDRTGEATATGRGVGQPMDGVDVRLDEAGRVVVRSAAVVEPGEHTLADLGGWTEMGELTLVGRATPMANIGGKKIAPQEIERIVRGLEGVTDVWVGVKARAGGDDFLLAAVETEGSREEVQRALAERLPAWQVPRQLWVTARLPRTARGKLDRREIEARCDGQGEREGGGL